MTSVPTAATIPASGTARTSSSGSPLDHAVPGRAARRALAVTRLLMAAVFLWPVADKSFGLGYATPPEGAWTGGASPTAGYLGSLTGPPADLFGGLTGPVVDWLFMLGMLGTGLALLLGIGLRAAAVAGGLLMLSLWVTSWPFAAGSANPVVDQHLVYAAVLTVLALTRAGDTWGLGRAWAGSPVPGTSTVLR